jgi:NitT/TauT family transport system substrate-binding protein
MKFRYVGVVSAAAVMMLAAGCSSSAEAPLNVEKPNIVVDAFPAIDSAGLYIAQMDNLFAAQGLHVTIEPVQSDQTTQTEIDGQLNGTYDITAGDYVTYIDNELAGTAKLRIIAEGSFLQPNVLTLLVKGGSPIDSIAQLRHKVISVNAPDDVGTLLVDSLLAEHDISPRQVTFNNDVAFPAVAQNLEANRINAAFTPEPFASLDEQNAGVEELADLDQGSTADFPIQGYAVTQAWAAKYPNTLEAFTRALSEGQEIADTDRAAVERAVEKYLRITPATAAFLALPSFPAGMDTMQLQRVVSAMLRFGLLPPKDQSFKIQTMTGG